MHSKAKNEITYRFPNFNGADVEVWDAQVIFSQTIWWYKFSVEVCLEGVCPHSVSKRQDSCVRVYAPHTQAPPSRKKNEQGVTQLSIWTKRGGVWADAWVCLHYRVVIWVAG